MAYIVTNKEKKLSFISKDLEQLKKQIPTMYETYMAGICGYVIEISQTNFDLLKNNTKQVDLIDDSLNVTYKNHDNHIYSNKEEIDLYIEKLKKDVKEKIGHTEGVYNDELISYQNTLNNFDTSSLNYPFSNLQNHFFQLNLSYQ